MKNTGGRALIGLFCIFLCITAWGEVEKKPQEVNLGEIVVQIETVKALKNGKVDIYLNFTNQTKNVLWIGPVGEVLGSDAKGVTYSCINSTGFGSGKPLRLLPKVPATASFQLQRLDSVGTPDKDEKSPVPDKISLRASLVIIHDPDKEGDRVGLTLLDIAVVK